MYSIYTFTKQILKISKDTSNKSSSKFCRKRSLDCNIKFGPKVGVKSACFTAATSYLFTLLARVHKHVEPILKRARIQYTSNKSSSKFCRKRSLDCNIKFGPKVGVKSACFTAATSYLFTLLARVHKHVEPILKRVRIQYTSNKSSSKFCRKRSLDCNIKFGPKVGVKSACFTAATSYLFTLLARVHKHVEPILKRARIQYTSNKSSSKFCRKRSLDCNIKFGPKVGVKSACFTAATSYLFTNIAS